MRAEEELVRVPLIHNRQLWNITVPDGKCEASIVPAESLRSIGDRFIVSCGFHFVLISILVSRKSRKYQNRSRRL